MARLSYAGSRPLPKPVTARVTRMPTDNDADDMAGARPTVEPQQDNPDPGPKMHHGHDMGASNAKQGKGSGARGYGHASGLEAAMAAHADKVHPVK